MQIDRSEPAMDRKIFDMNLDVESVSIYILCCALKDAGARITQDNLADKWNGDTNALERGLATLVSRHILQEVSGGSGKDTPYTLTQSGFWKDVL